MKQQTAGTAVLTGKTAESVVDAPTLDTPSSQTSE